MKRLCLVLSLLVATGVAPIAVADAARGKALYAGCVACHGDSGAGNDALQAPALAGLDAVYLAPRATRPCSRRASWASTRHT